jgi:hypothetical protein
MRFLAALTSLCVGAALLSGCSAIHNAQQSAMHSALRASFKTSFIHSCTGAGATEQICTCVEGKIEAANTDDQLTKMQADSPATNKMLVDDARACAAGK